MTATALDHCPRRAPPERSCFTCANSPPYPGESDCYALDFTDENDGPIAAYCDASGANDDDNPEPGWPRLRSLTCPAWRARQ